MEIVLRPEEEKDFRRVEELTREAFWNVYAPGCCEHVLVHNLRNAKEFVKELDFVAVCGDTIVGNIVYAETKVKNDDSEYPVLTFGPVSVLPEYQNKEIGSALINRTIPLARDRGYKAIILYGDPAFYKRFGFKESKEYGITNKGKKYPAALLVCELSADALNGITGIFEEGEIYDISEDEIDAFEQGFRKKEKYVTKTQERFLEIASKYV
ncbi:MAG: N-acetyltransferase [Spirochaetaceae bacterium]|jgi:predicted N-acetyltransferase YhbS|nr:N-acetyltransferase [Spirochaetaceae bacterium]